MAQVTVSVNGFPEPIQFYVFDKHKCSFSGMQVIRVGVES